MAGSANKNNKHTVESMMRTLLALDKDIYVLALSNAKSGKVPFLVNHLKAQDRYVQLSRAREIDYRSTIKRIRQVFDENEIEQLIVLKMPLLRTCRHGDVYAPKHYMQKIDDGDYKSSYGYEMTNKLTTIFLVIREAVFRDIEIFQYFIDPLEPYVEEVFPSAKVKKAYLLNRNGLAKCIPLFEPYIYNLAKKFPKNKLYDVVFRATCVSPERKPYIKLINDLGAALERDKSINAHRVACETNAERNVTQQQYYEELAFANVTYMIPSYCVDTFSWHRFFEAICLDCLPIIICGTNLQDVKDTYPDIYDVIESSDIVVGRSASIKDIIECTYQLCRGGRKFERQKIIDRIKATESFKNIISKKYVRQKYLEVQNGE